MLLTPRWVLRRREKNLLRAYQRDKEELDKRIDYYCRLEGKHPLPPSLPTLASHTYKNKRFNSVYFFDTFEFTRYFPKGLRWQFAPGDVIGTFDLPTVSKTRPLFPEKPEEAANSVLLCLDKVRHVLNPPMRMSPSSQPCAMAGC